MSKIQLVSKTYSSAESAYRAVKERILSGGLTGGELISEGEIAAELGTSRTPVREAFLRLETEGWMKLYPKRGALVVPVPPDEAEHVAHARYVVETAAVRAVTSGDPATLSAELTANIARQRELAEAGDLEAFALADTDFHRGYVVAGGNPLLTDFYDSLRERQRRMNSLALRRGPLDIAQIIDQHVHLAGLIAARDADGFATALVEHFAGVHQLELRGL
ncbi:GntR family transcriptional regulator [Nocardia higoensis]|uniref:GntR family transcriptional regulator n=1 Tax=Nocardia higoensis TaxID=228599 RepID=A0ABS0DC42_9NOCA|nr:GntR family transcriptional regulator [Nocardia higoensis]MBF6355398.1 GntR family transcriptional regulator [Nocardia higoensis]